MKSTAEHSLLSCAVVKNEWNFMPFLTNLHSMHNDLTFTCFLLIISLQNNQSSYQYFVCYLPTGDGAMQTV